MCRRPLFFEERLLRATTNRPFRRRLLRWLLLAAFGWLAASVLLVLILRFVPPPTSAFMLGRTLEAMLAGERDFRLHYRWTPIEHMSVELPIAMVAAEDQKFPHHRGFDIDAIQAAMAEAGEGERLRGASTISQQLAKNLFLWSGRSFVRKGLEAYFTVLIEVLWPKRRILEVYLNIAEFGDGVYGVGAAGERYFKRGPEALDARQAALLAAVLPNPRRLRVDAPSAHVERRAAWVQRQVRQLGGPAYLALP
ncbi:MAG TPA: monofunctional biosynthetic peptidoglycan transglycosylase [Dokdonella sp.]|nr:monofunctional biosynthetic peptidoglycan transglycosylase [Dokdonella sp.]